MDITRNIPHDLEAYLLFIVSYQIMTINKLLVCNTKEALQERNEACCYDVSHHTLIRKRYTLHQKKVTFNLSICPGAPGSLTLTDGLDHSVK